MVETNNRDRGYDEDVEQLSNTTLNDDENNQIDRIVSGKDVEYEEVEVPDGGYGWFIVVAVFLFNFSASGSTAAYAVYLAHYLNNDVFPGVTKIEYGILGGLKFGTGMLIAPVLNRAIGKLGIHGVMGIGIFLMCISLLLASWATQFWELVLTQGILNGVGIGTITVSAITLIPQWFRDKRSLAQGITVAGSGAGGVTLVLALQQVIAVESYQWALRVEAILCTVIALIAVLLTRTRAEYIHPQFAMIDKECFNFGHLLIIMWVIWTMLGYIVLLYNLGDFTQSLGYSSHAGSIVITMISVGGFFFRPVIGTLSDWYGPITVSIVVHCLVAIFSWAMWIPARNLATAIVFSLIQGALMGTIWVLMAPITTRVVGLTKVGTCLGNIWVFIGASSIISPIIGLKLKKDSSTTTTTTSSDPTQYVDPAIFVGLMYFAATVTLFILRGWIIARDEIMLDLQSNNDDKKEGRGEEEEEEEEENLKEDTGAELLVTVPYTAGAKSCFKLKSIRNV